MLDPEALVIKGGVLILVVLAVFRLVLQDLHSLANDFQRIRKRRRLITRPND
jgi:hypothetical protein